jgi:hypothetical protein
MHFGIGFLIIPVQAAIGEGGANMASGPVIQSRMTSENHTTTRT